MLTLIAEDRAEDRSRLGWIIPLERRVANLVIDRC
jgi:hypothetical protein